jgi:hypothetical protein
MPDQLRECKKETPAQTEADNLARRINKRMTKRPH